MLKQAERDSETELEEAAKEAKRSAKLFGNLDLVRNVLKVIPGVGIVVTIVFGAKSVEAKGVEAGTIDIVLDQTPLLGEVKLVVEIVTGKDIVPDYEYINPNPPHPSEGFKPHSEMSGPKRTRTCRVKTSSGGTCSGWPGCRMRMDSGHRNRWH